MTAASLAKMANEMTVALCTLILAPSVLTVGDGKTYIRIEDALAVARAGDSIEVFPAAAGYKKTALKIAMPSVKIIGKSSDRIVLDGDGFDYSGVGPVPRAIVQVDPGADKVRIEHFELRGAHNASHNGAGIRINAANNVRVTDCDIHGSDMGVMSNGTEGNPRAGSGQLFEDCLIHENGSTLDPGYNHNLYLGGNSVTLRRCEVWGALTGHNLKSRAHFTLVTDSYIHDSANREADIVEAWDTERPNSNAVFVNTVVRKNPNCAGNRGVIHFGQEKGRRDGTLWMINCTVVTPFPSAVVALSSGSASTRLLNCVIANVEQTSPELCTVSNGALAANVFGDCNWISPSYRLDGTAVAMDTRFADGGPDLASLLHSGTFALIPSGTSWHAAEAYYLDGDGKRVNVPQQRPLLGASWKPPAVWSP